MQGSHVQPRRAPPRRAHQPPRRMVCLPWPPALAMRELVLRLPLCLLLPWPAGLWRGWRASCGTSRAPSSLSPTTAVYSSPSPDGARRDHPWCQAFAGPRGGHADECRSRLDRIVEIEFGRMQVFEGNYSSYLQQKEKLLSDERQMVRQQLLSCCPLSRRLRQPSPASFQAQPVPRGGFAPRPTLPWRGSLPDRPVLASYASFSLSHTHIFTHSLARRVLRRRR